MKLNTIFYLLISFITLFYNQSVFAINKVQDGLYTAEATAPSGEKIYLGFEEINEYNYRFWLNYYKTTETYGLNILKSFTDSYDNKLNRQKRSAIITKISKSINYTSPHLKTNLRFLCEASGIPAGLIGFKHFLAAANNPEKEAYIVYVSKTPVTKPSQENFVCTTSTNYSDEHLYYSSIYNNLIISVGLITSKDSLSTTHMGIFKNPVNCITSDSNYKNISTMLHGFAARCAMDILGKKFQVNRPNEAMATILQKSCPNAVIAKINDNRAQHNEFSELDHCPVVQTNPILKVDLEELAKLFIAE